MLKLLLLILVRFLLMLLLIVILQLLLQFLDPLPQELLLLRPALPAGLLPGRH